jgi:hypothetical protein
MFSDSAITATSLGLLTLVALRWKTLPEDIRTVQFVVNYLCHLGYLQFKNRGSFSTHVDSGGHYPRPPRTIPLPPTPPRNYNRTVSDDAELSEDSGEEAAEAKELDLKEDRGESPSEESADDKSEKESEEKEVEENESEVDESAEESDKASVH